MGDSLRRTRAAPSVSLDIGEVCGFAYEVESTKGFPHIFFARSK
jgi:hypothetical protein